MKTRTILLLLFLCSQTITLRGQEPTEYNRFWELGIGMGMNLNSYNTLPDNGRAFFSKGKPLTDYSLRFQRFFDRHWGAFLSYDITISHSRNCREILKGMSPQHGMAYLLPTDERVRGISRFGISIGLIYRHDIRRWSFRPYLGIGVTGDDIGDSEFIYYSKAHGSNDMQKTKMSLDSGDDLGYSGINITPGISVNYTLTGALYVFCDCSCHIHPCKGDVEWMTTDINHQLPVDQGRSKVQMGNLLTLKAGVGLQCRKKKKKKE